MTMYNMPQGPGIRLAGVESPKQRHFSYDFFIVKFHSKIS
jgi:hypothetical protein